jgi:hypothetical protein
MHESTDGGMLLGKAQTKCQICGSGDGTLWVVVVTAMTSWSEGQERIFEFSNGISYNFYGMLEKRKKGRRTSRCRGKWQSLKMSVSKLLGESFPPKAIRKPDRRIMVFEMSIQL